MKIDEDFQQTMIKRAHAVREVAEKAYDGWPVNITFNGIKLDEFGELVAEFKVVPAELPTSPRGNHVSRPVGRPETGEYEGYVKTLVFPFPRGAP